MSTVADVKTLPNYAGGEFREAAVDSTLEDRDPATGELSAYVPLSGREDVDQAVRAAREAQPAWRDTPAAAARPRRDGAARGARRATATSSPRWSPPTWARRSPTPTARSGAGSSRSRPRRPIPHLLKGENLEGVAKGLDVELVRQPVGVVAAITPFNFPAMIPLWFLPYAVACGNAFILKPSERDPRPSQRIFELIDEREIFPPGVVNLVHGGRDAVEGILEHPGIDAISFVGQATTARLIATRGAETGKRVQALGGAKNSLIVMPDADLDVTVPAIMGSAFGAAGQRCLAGSVCVVVGDEARAGRGPRRARAAPPRR